MEIEAPCIITEETIPLAQQQDPAAQEGISPRKAERMVFSLAKPTGIHILSLQSKVLSCLFQY